MNILSEDNVKGCIKDVMDDNHIYASFGENLGELIDCMDK